MTAVPELVSYAEQLCAERMAAYRAAPHDAEEHANIETAVLAGGYAYRQVAELIQNAADAIAEVGTPGDEGRIFVEADARGLWCANTGIAVDQAGVKALLNSHASGKRAGQIGRFGLGFKSLLRLGGTIDVLSRSVCLHFDPARNRDRIRAHLNLPVGAPAPGLRLAEAGLWDEEVATAPGADRFNWATTVVFAELRSESAREAVIDEIRRFPSEFLLFLPCDIELVLRAPEVNRHLRRVTGDDGIVTIEDVVAERSNPQRFHVFETSVRITDPAALEDATSVHARDQVPLIWAAPAGIARETAGRFYAFFPTQTETRTLGILNAPWKLNSDRTGVIPGAWNAALMQAAADLIIDCLPQLATAEDPGAVLDAFPRELITQNEPAAPLVNALWSRLTNAAVLPNCDAEPTRHAELRRAPLDDSEVIAAWARVADLDACQTFLHASCTATRERVGRLRNLTERLSALSLPGNLPCLRPAASLEWLQLTASDEVDAAAEVLAFADRYAGTVPGYQWDSVRDNARLILTTEGQLAAAPEVTLASPAEPPLRSVHPVLRDGSEANRILRQRFNVQDGEETDWERMLDVWIERAEQNGDWTGVWRLLRRMPWDDLQEQLGWRSIEVKTLGGWAAAEDVLRPGALIQADDLATVKDEKARPQLAALLVDMEFHRDDSTILTELGVRESPADVWQQAHYADDQSLASAWLAKWQSHCVSNYHALLGARPDRHLLGPETFSLPVCWSLLVLSPDQRRPAVTSHFLNVFGSANPVKYAPVTFRHSSRRNIWATKTYRHPVISLLRQSGVLTNQTARISLGSLTMPGMPDPAGLFPSLGAHEAALSALRTASTGKSVDDLSPTWTEWLDFAAGEVVEPRELVALYNAAADAGVVPAQVSTPVGARSLADIRVASSRHEVSLACQAGVHAVCLGPVAAQRWIAAGAKSFDKEAQLEWIAETGETPTILLLDLEPALRDVLKAEFADTAAATMTSLMERQIGDHRIAVEWTIENGQLLLAQDALTNASWPDRIRMLIDAAHRAGWIDDDDALDKVLKSGVSARRRKVAAEPDLASRLLRATGGALRIAPLFEADVQAMLADQPDRLAQVAITLFGPGLLALAPIRDALAAQGLEPPERWGTEAAVDFVTSIGFTADYAISPTHRREAELAISGPLPLKPLHDFQSEVVTDLKALFADETSRRRRAVISLPTGAGKTRVAAETAVREILSAESGNRLVLWIAQSDELCEQAVQCFRELWANVGAQEETLRLIRLWGGQVNPSPASRDEPAVIVASIQTLSSRMNDPALSWASRPGLVVIDECHHAYSPVYTGMLRWLSPEAKTDEREAPVVGLSATPFRGRSDDETRALANRFDNRLFPREQKELFELLQQRGVLARFGYTCLRMSERFVLTEEEEKHLDKFQQLNESALTRLGENQERNDRILEEIAASKEKSALVFATSVAHAHRLAARLNVMGITAATVTGETDRASRRWFIRGFQRGTIRVLCNHSALTTGFDAPATDLIVIARPVFSPALYMQMVGRGLRGPANGGKEHCRILTIQDNLDAYTGKLAHHYFEQHYVEAENI